MPLFPYSHDLDLPISLGDSLIRHCITYGVKSSTVFQLACIMQNKEKSSKIGSMLIQREAKLLLKATLSTRGPHNM